MVFFGDVENKILSEGLSKAFSLTPFYPEITVFSDGERRVRLEESVVDEDVVFVKTASVTHNVDSFIIETAFLIDSIKRSGASKVTGIIPYLPYSRADHVFRDGEAVPLEVVIHLLENAGLNKIIFVDPHTIKMTEMFDIEAINLSGLPLFAKKIEEIGFDKDDSVIVSPDMGGLRRLEQLSHLLHNLPIASVEKERDYSNGSIKSKGVHGQIKKTCFIIDDIIASGKTIVQCVDQLFDLGAERVYVFATHPVLSDDSVNILQKSKAEKIFVTDSIPVPQNKKFEKLEIMSLSDIISSSFSK